MGLSLCLNQPKGRPRQSSHASIFTLSRILLHYFTIPARQPTLWTHRAMFSTTFSTTTSTRSALSARRTYLFIQPRNRCFTRRVVRVRLSPGRALVPSHSPARSVCLTQGPSRRLPRCASRAGQPWSHPPVRITSFGLPGRVGAFGAGWPSVASCLACLALSLRRRFRRLFWETISA